MGKYSFGKNGPTFNDISMLPATGTVVTAFNSVTTTATPAVGSCAVQFALKNLGSAGPSLFTTTAAGLLGLTITALADNYWVVFVKPDGTLLISDVCTVS